MSMTSTWFSTFRLEFNPSELIAFGEIDTPDVVEIDVFCWIVNPTKDIHIRVHESSSVSKSSKRFLPQDLDMVYPTHVLDVQN